MYIYIYTLSVNYKPGDRDSARAWILKAGSGWHQAETAEDPQNMNKFAAGSLGAATAHRIKWILSGQSAGEQMRQWQQALFLASLRFCVHYCIDHDTVPKKKNRASRGFFVGLSTPNLKMIWSQTTNRQT